jgi:hypothetical protein
MLFVFRMGNCRDEVLVSGRPADVFRQARALAGDTQRIRPVRHGLAGRFDDDAMLPAVAEIVFEFADVVAETRVELALVAVLRSRLRSAASSELCIPDRRCGSCVDGSRSSP